MVTTPHTSNPQTAVAKFVARALRGRASWYMTVGAVVLIVVVGVLDYLTGFQSSFAPLYMLPVAVIAWFHGRAAGVTAAFFAGATQFAFDLAAAGSTLFLPGILWNTLSVILLAAFMAVTLALLHNVLDHESSLARTDPTTAVSNSRGFGERLAAEMARSRRYERPFSVAYVDLDDFKQVNDRLGHEAGDRLLGLAGAAITRVLRESDSIGRLGGDEFAVLFPETDEDAARAVGDKLLAALAKLSCDEDWRTSASIGIATFTHSPGSGDEVLRHADDLMYEAKRSGKGRVMVATIAPQSLPPAADRGRDDRG